MQQAKSSLWIVRNSEKCNTFGLLISIVVFLIFTSYYLYLENSGPPLATYIQQDTNSATVGITINNIEENSNVIAFAYLDIEPEQLVENPDEISKICVEEVSVFSHSRGRIQEPYTPQFSYPISGYCYEKRGSEWKNENEPPETDNLPDRALVNQPDFLNSFQADPGSVVLFDQSSNEPSRSQTPISLPQITLSKFWDETPTFFYPLDERSGAIIFSLRINVTDKNNKSTSKQIAPHVYIIDASLSSNWKSEIKVEDYLLFTARSTEELLRQNLQGESERRIRITISSTRRRSVSIFTAVLLLSIFALIYRLSVTEDMGNFMEVAVGILLGLWGIQEILIPNYITQSVFITALIFSMYVLFAYIIIIKVFSHSVGGWSERSIISKFQEQSPTIVSAQKERKLTAFNILSATMISALVAIFRIVIAIHNLRKKS